MTFKRQPGNTFFKIKVEGHTVKTAVLRIYEEPELGKLLYKLTLIVELLLKDQRWNGFIEVK